MREYEVNSTFKPGRPPYSTHYFQESNMKSKQGFFVTCGVSLLMAALQLSGSALAGDAASKAKEITVTDDQYVSTQTVANTAAAVTQPERSAAQHQAYAETLYRNGGYFGDKNSDVRLEKAGQ
jgi:hypothetical protein